MAKRVVIWGGALAALLFVLWLAFGYYVYSLNSIPPVPPLERSLPGNNVYPEYVTLVTQVKRPKDLQRLLASGDFRGKEADELLKINGEILKQLHSLAGKPSMVTELMPGEKFVGALAFPAVTRLAALQVRRTAASQPGEALAALLDGAHFSAGVMRGGATLHVTTGFLCFVPLFQAAPALADAGGRFCGHVPQKDLAAASEELRKIHDSVTPLTEIFRAERWIRLTQYSRTVRPGATRIFRLSFPREQWDREALLRPKRPGFHALDAYMSRWVEEAGKPPVAIALPEPPRELEGILADESLAPGNMLVHCLRYAHVLARLRILHAAMRLELHRRKTGAYPATLEAVVSGPLLTDPYSGSPLRYARSGGRYELYSVGPNGQDDGGMPFREGRMRPDVTGDLTLRPMF